MVRYQTFASMLRTAALVVLFALLPAGCASAQSACFDAEHLTKYLSDLLGTTCTVGTSTDYVTYTWNASTDSTPGYVCESDSGTTCPLASQITVSQKDNGCSDDDGSTNTEVYALLFVQSDSTLNVNSNDMGDVGHYLDIAIYGSLTVYGNTSGTHHNFNWPHFDCGVGQGGSGVETNTTKIYCGLSCTGNGVSTIQCDANSKINNPKTCYDDTTATDYSDYYDAPFTGGATTPYYFTIAMTVTSPTGSASNSAFLYSLGTHIVP